MRRGFRDATDRLCFKKKRKKNACRTLIGDQFRSRENVHGCIAAFLLILTDYNSIIWVERKKERKRKLNKMTALNKKGKKDLD